MHVPIVCDPQNFFGKYGPKFPFFLEEVSHDPLQSTTSARGRFGPQQKWTKQKCPSRTNKKKIKVFEKKSCALDAFLVCETFSTRATRLCIITPTAHTAFASRTSVGKRVELDKSSMGHFWQKCSTERHFLYIWKIRPSTNHSSVTCPKPVWDTFAKKVLRITHYCLRSLDLMFIHSADRQI